MDLAGMVALVRVRLKDVDNAAYFWSDDEIEAAIASAMGAVSESSPDCGTELFDGDGSTRTFDCSAVTGYQYALAVEYPVGEEPPSYLPFRENELGKVIVRADPPVDGADNVRVYFARPFDAAADPWTLPADDELTVELGASASLAEAGAVYASGRLNANENRAELLRKSAYGWHTDFHARLKRGKQRQIGPTWWPHWPADADDV
jgi:hypothetical protein